MGSVSPMIFSISDQQERFYVLNGVWSQGQQAALRVLSEENEVMTLWGNLPRLSVTQTPEEQVRFWDITSAIWSVLHEGHEPDRVDTHLAAPRRELAEAVWETAGLTRKGAYETAAQLRECGAVTGIMTAMCFAEGVEVDVSLYF